MQLSGYIAWRYFFSKDSSNAVNIITGISLLGILIGSAALIIVLSAFNGLESLVKGFYADFDPELKIEVERGKFFALEDIAEEWLTDPNIEAYSYTLEEKALLNFRDREYISTLKGVDSRYLQTNKLQNKILYGEYRLAENLAVTPSVMGAGVAYFLGFSRGDFQEPVTVFLPREGGNRLDPESNFRSSKIFPLGIFSIQPDFDEKYALVPLEYLQKLLNRPGEVSALELKFKAGSRLKKEQKKWQVRLGDDFRVLTRDEQQASFLKVMKTEGLFTFLVFALILGIAIFTVAGSLIMLMFEKRQHLYSLWAMGSSMEQLRASFVRLGILISAIGGLGGLLLGTLIVVAQQYGGLLSVGDGYVVDAYPVELRWQDLLLVSGTVLGLGALTSFISARGISLKLLRS